MGDHAKGDPSAKPAQNVERLVHAAHARATNPASLRMSKTPSNGTIVSTATMAMSVAISPASPKVRIRSDCRKLQGNERNTGGGMREHASRPGDQQGIAKGGKFVVAGDQPVTRRKGELHAVGKTDDHDERRHHVQKDVQAEIEPAERAERQQNGGERRRGGDDHERYAAEEQDRDQAAGDKAKRVIDQPVALDRVAGLQLHHRDAGQFAAQTGARQMLVDGLRGPR